MNFPLDRNLRHPGFTVWQHTAPADPDTVERFKRQGPDWRARMGAALKRAAGD
jgi:BrnA antitoxin of type II toxin-antitoxin system